MGKLTISMAIFHSFLYVYQAGYFIDSSIPIFPGDAQRSPGGLGLDEPCML